LFPATNLSAPAFWICNAGYLIDAGTLAADLNSLTAMPLLRRHKFDSAVAVLVVIPIHKRRNPLPGFFFAAEWPVGVVRPVFNGAEMRFGIGIVV